MCGKWIDRRNTHKRHTNYDTKSVKESPVRRDEESAITELTGLVSEQVTIFSNVEYT